MTPAGFVIRLSVRWGFEPERLLHLARVQVREDDDRHDHGAEADAGARVLEEPQEGLEDAEASRYVDSYLKAIIYSGSGDKEKALSELEKAFQNRSTWLIWVRVEPKFDSLHNDRRFQDLLQRMNLPAV